MASSWKRWLYPVGLLLGGLLLGIQVWLTIQSLQKTPLALFRPWSLVGALGAVAAATLVQIVAWQIIMIGLGVEVDRWRLARGYLLPFVARYIPGSVWGYLGRSQWMYQNHQVPYSKTNIASALEMLSVLTTAAVILCVYVANQSAGILRIGLVGLAVAIPPSVWLGLQSNTVSRLTSRLPRWMGYVGSYRLLALRRWVALLGLHLLLWLCYGVAVRLVIASLTIGPDPALNITTFVFATSWLVGFFVVFIPSGLGVREFTMSSLLVAVAGMPGGVASATALLLRALLLTTEVAFVAVLLLSTIMTHNRFPAS